MNGLRLRGCRRGQLYLILWILALGLTGTANAHAFLITTSPQAGERLAAAPSRVILRFSEPFVLGTEQVSLHTTEGEKFPIATLEPIDGGLQLRAELPPLDEGIYRVSWQVLADDAHLSAGEFAFAVGEGGQLSAASNNNTAAIPWSKTLGSLLVLAGLILAIGGLVSERIVWWPVARPRSLALPRAPVAASLLLSLLGVALHLILLVGALEVDGASSRLNLRSWLAVISTRPGLLTVVELVFIIYALWLVVVPKLRVWGLLPLGGAVLVAAFRGHSGTAEVWWAAPSNALHLFLAAIWIGALLHLLQVLWALRKEGFREPLCEAAQRYASLALVLVPLLLVAGVVTALPEFSRPAELIETTYGRVLLVKLLLVTAALMIALIARLRTLPLKTEGLRLFRRLVGTEGITLLGVVGMSALLVNAPSPRGMKEPIATELLGPAPLTGPVVRLAALPGQLSLYLAAAEDQLQLRVLQPSGEPAVDVGVEVSGRAPDGVGLDLYPRSCGRGCFTMDFGWPEGSIDVTVAVSHGTWQGGIANFSVPWPPGPDQTNLLDKVIQTMKDIPRFTLTEQVSSGPGATAPPRTFEVPNPFFISEEVYARGGATDMRRLPSSDPELTELILYLPGSAMWYKLWFDANYRLRRELIINPGHRIERSFDYEVESNRRERSTGR